MSCVHCGKKLSDDAKFCESCGRPTVLTPIPANLVNVPNEPASASSFSSEATRRVPIALYGKFAFGMVCFTACVAGCVFLIAEAAATLDPNQFGKVGGSMMGVFFTAVWASRTWKRIQETEPESDGTFRRNHRSVLLKVFGVVSIVLIIACVLGISAGRKELEMQRIVRSMVELNREQHELDNRFMQTATYKNLRHPASFSSAQVAANTLSEFEQYASISEGLMKRKESLLEVNSAPLLNAQFDAFRVIIFTTKELYRYAQDPSHHVHLVDGFVAIDDGEEFNKRMDAANDALHRFEWASAALTKEQTLRNAPTE